MLYLGNSRSFTAKAVYISTVIFLSFLAMPAMAAEATLSLAPAGGSFNLGDTFTIKVMAEADEAMNAAEAKLTFDKNILQVVSVSKEGSAFSLWTVEPAFSNSEGTIEFGGGSPKPITTKATIVTIVFKSLKTGNIKIDFASGSVLAADGKGTDILSQKVPGDYEIKPKPAASLPPTTGATTPPAPVIESDTHPDIGVWYNKSKIKFSWDIPIGVLSVRSAFDEASDTIPEELEPPATTSKEIEAEDGTWYLHLQFKNKDVWGPATHRKVLIDTVAPEDLTVGVEPGFEQTSLPSLKLDAKDELSGIRNYEIIIGTNSPLVVKAEDLRDGLYPVPEMNDGNYPVLVRVYDNAGNKSETTIDLELKTGRTAPVKASAEDELEEKTWFQKFGELFSIELILIIILSAVICYLVYKIMLQKRVLSETRGSVRKGTMDIRTLVGKIFSALIDEVEEQLMAIDHKPRLSQNEQRIFDQIKEAVDISEGLIDEQIKSVEKSLGE